MYNNKNVWGHLVKVKVAPEVTAHGASQTTNCCYFAVQIYVLWKWDNEEALCIRNPNLWLLMDKQSTHAWTAQNSIRQSTQITSHKFTMMTSDFMWLQSRRVLHQSPLQSINGTIHKWNSPVRWKSLLRPISFPGMRRSLSVLLAVVHWVTVDQGVELSKQESRHINTIDTLHHRCWCHNNNLNFNLHISFPYPGSQYIISL